MMLEPGQQGECRAWVRSVNEIEVWCDRPLDHTGNHRNEHTGLEWNQ